MLYERPPSYNTRNELFHEDKAETVGRLLGYSTPQRLEGQPHLTPAVLNP